MPALHSHSPLLFNLCQFNGLFKYIFNLLFFFLLTIVHLYLSCVFSFSFAVDIFLGVVAASLSCQHLSSAPPPPFLLTALPSSHFPFFISNVREFLFES